MQKDANLVELEKCCRTHIFLQKFVLIQPRTSPPKICKILQNFANFANFANPNPLAGGPRRGDRAAGPAGAAGRRAAPERLLLAARSAPPPCGRLGSWLLGGLVFDNYIGYGRPCGKSQITERSETACLTVHFDRFSNKESTSHAKTCICQSSSSSSLDLVKKN